ncbi:hypothetical protein SCA6_005084 [Theobroma cacao]
MLVQYLAATLKQQLDASSFSFLSKVALLVIRQSPSLGFDAICKKKDGNALAATCDGCEKPISGPCYGCCTYCEFYLHYECARLPRQIEHFFHPRPLVLKLYYYTCNACFMPSSGFSYSCVTCHFNMHVDYVSRPTIKSESEGLIQHFTHWHPLTLVDPKNKQEEDQKVCCAICEKLCSDSAYGCQQCSFFLHNSCMTTVPRKINHFFHRCPLILLTYPSYACGGCEKSLSGLTYSCGKCRFKLDVKCGLLPTIESKGADMIQHCTHPHPLALLDQNKDIGSEVRGRCRACGEDCLYPSFRCNRSCDFFIHASCAELPQEIHHPFHLWHPLNLTFFWQQQQHNRSCFARSQRHDAFLLAYCCFWCDFTLHKDCAQFTPPFNYGNYLHALTLCDKRPSPFDCNVCGKKAKKFFLRCAVCGFNIHLYCLPSVPKTIRHKCHIDSLTLTKSPLEFELNSPEVANNSDDKFYCDVCEEKRDRRDPVYHCTECKFSAKVGCVISELIPSYITPGDQNAESSQVISMDEENSATNHTLETLNNVIAEPSAKPKLLMEERGPLKVEIEPLKLKLGQLEARLQEIEAELNQTTKRLDNLEVHRFLCMYQPRHSMKENYGFD